MATAAAAAATTARPGLSTLGLSERLWRRSRPFGVRAPGISAEKLLDAIEAEPRCARCASGADGILTAAGEASILEVASVMAEAYTIASFEVAAAGRQMYERVDA